MSVKCKTAEENDLYCQQLIQKGGGEAKGWLQGKSEIPRTYGSGRTRSEDALIFLEMMYWSEGVQIFEYVASLETNSGCEPDEDCGQKYCFVWFD